MNILSFMLPFTNSVWFSCLITIIFSGLTYFFLAKPIKIYEDRSSDTEETEESEEETHSQDVRTSLYKAAMAFTGNFDFEAETLATRLWSFSMAFWVMLMLTAYTANLASFL